MLSLIEKLFGLSGKAQIVVLTITHLTAVVIGIILGMVFAKPTIIVNDDENRAKAVRESEETTQNQPVSYSSGYSSKGDDFKFRTQLIRFMPPRPEV